MHNLSQLDGIAMWHCPQWADVEVEMLCDDPLIVKCIYFVTDVAPGSAHRDIESSCTLYPIYDRDKVESKIKSAVTEMVIMICHVNDDPFYVCESAYKKSLVEPAKNTQ